jgi:predicted HTH domain antitoxin
MNASQNSTMQIVLNIPSNIKLDASEHDIKMLLACKLYEAGVLDTGCAAKSIGMERADFIMEMPKYGVSIFERTGEELEEDVKNAAKFVR